MITLMILLVIAVLIIFTILCMLGVIAGAMSGIIFLVADVTIAVLILKLAFGGHKKKEKK